MPPLISQTDCPAKTADPYPGKRTHKNPGGSLLTRNVHTEEQVQLWINHFKDSEKYQNETVSGKVMYLQPHLKAVNVSRKAALKLLVKLESKDNRQGEVEVERQLDNVREEEMDLDIEAENLNEPNDENIEMRGADYSSDEDMFADDTHDQRRSKYEFELARVLAKTDEELFEGGLQVSKRISKSRKYMERKTKFTEKYVEETFEGLSSQDILTTFSQNPLAVQESKAMKNKLKHLGKKEKANKVILKSVQDTIDVLNRTPGQSAKNQVKIITASVTHHRWGTPGLKEVGHRTVTDAKTMKLDLLKGSDLILTPPAKSKRNVYPKQLEDLGEKHWIENTTIEPALHRRKAELDDKETIPTR